MTLVSNATDHLIFVDPDKDSVLFKLARNDGMTVSTQKYEDLSGVICSLNTADVKALMYWLMLNRSVEVLDWVNEHLAG